ncbi:MAG: recombinase family protein [Clostridiales bacterium]|nr:recombinase family protein [Clostridiales bacterium]
MARKSRQAQQQASALGTSNTVTKMIPANSTPVYKAGIYARLSVYDLARDRSDTMENQIALLENYVEQQPDIVLTDLYIDNGRTGTTFNRPEFLRLMDDVKSGKITCIIVKDLSRFGRNYLETGYYLQKVFPQYNLRFIAVNDQYDSLTADPDSMAISMKNIINDYYSKDISRKVSSSFDLKKSQGVYSWGHPPYGYVRNKENPTQLEFDTEVEPYVHLMFRWALDGVPIHRIAKNLTEMQAPTYQRLAHIRSNGHTKRKGSDEWAHRTVMQILMNQTYAGDFVGNKSYDRKYDKANARFFIPEDEWMIIPNTHPAYIDREDYFRLKERILSDRQERSQILKEMKTTPVNFENKFQGIIFCGECQRRISLRGQRDMKTLYRAFYCKGKRDQFHKGHKPFSIDVDTMELTVLWQLNLQIKYALDADAFLECFSLEEASSRLKARRQAEVNMLRAKAADIKKRRSRTFEDFSNALIDEDVYRIQMD